MAFSGYAPHYRAMRALVLLVCAVPLAAQEAVSPFAALKARTLLREQLPCLGCHELDGDGGRNAPSLTTVGQRRSAAYIRAIIDDPQAVVPGAAMPRTVMAASTRETIARLLTRHAVAGPPPPDRVARAVTAVPPVALYKKWCVSCHGERGAGDGPDASRLAVRPAVHASAEAMSLRSDDALFDAIAGGGSVMGKSARMPAFGATLTALEMRSLVAYIRQLCRCAGPAWSRDDARR